MYFNIINIIAIKLLFQLLKELVRKQENRISTSLKHELQFIAVCYTGHVCLDKLFLYHQLIYIQHELTVVATQKFGCLFYIV